MKICRSILEVANAAPRSHYTIYILFVEFPSSTLSPLLVSCYKTKEQRLVHHDTAVCYSTELRMKVICPPEYEWTYTCTIQILRQLPVSCISKYLALAPFLLFISQIEQQNKISLNVNVLYMQNVCQQPFFFLQMN